ncbi:NAD-binding protein [Kitasatospora sp. NPDC059648]|uniref:NAD-binding protein n=1 Tax=Kitasatospora sp. NPDC059648 TaxID=3346894 RepID=UPI0036CB559E
MCHRRPAVPLGRPRPADRRAGCGRAGAVETVEARQLDEATLRAAGVATAAVLALTSGDDQANIHAGLWVRRINPG